MYGPKIKNSHPLRAKGGVLLTTSEEIKDRWVEHFSELINHHAEVDLSIVEDVEQHPINDSLDDPITESEQDQAFKNTKLGKNSGPDGVLAEVLVNGGAHLRASLLTMVTIFWSMENIPTDFIDPNTTIFYKKGDRSHCGNYRRISLLSIVGKVFADTILQRLKNLAELIYAQSQSGYRSGRSTFDGIFTLRQLMEKSREQRRNMYIAFVDFTKAFDTVNRDLCYGILDRLGCSAKFVRIIKKLYTNVYARIVVDGELTSPFEYNSGVKQDCKLAPTL